jgi:SAM-dependent methyltransferase
METLPFTEGEFDVIWSEGAVYNMGFEAGVSAWRRFLKPGGKLIVSEITWLSATRPPELQSH